MDDSLQRFVHDALDRGVARDEIAAALTRAGWATDEIDSALDLYVELDFPVPVPRPKPYVSAREAFVYLVLFTLLYLSAWSLGALLFRFIERGFPDPAYSIDLPTATLTAIRRAVAMLIIAFPGFLFLSWRTYRATRQETEKRKSRVRKWLTYLTLFLAAGTLVGDLISLVFNLLEGELTLRFVLKVVTVGGIAGAVFGYYLWDLKQDDAAPEAMPTRRSLLRLFTISVAAIVTLSILWGLWVAGSPGRARVLALDNQREGELARIADAIDLYFERHARLPDSLAELRGTRGVHVASIEDPATGKAYDFQPIGEQNYELCANFDSASEAPARRTEAAYPARSRFWDHARGRVCFEISVGPKGS